MQFSLAYSVFAALCLLHCHAVQALEATKPATTIESCANSCQGKSCDDWYSEEKYSCGMLEKDYGCSCSGCNCIKDKMLKACQVIKYAGDGNCDDGNNNAGCRFDGGMYLARILILLIYFFVMAFMILLEHIRMLHTVV